MRPKQNGAAQRAISPIQEKGRGPVRPQGEEIEEEPTKDQITILTIAEPSSPDNNDSIYNVLVSVLPPNGKERQPVDICCVIDISGSMGEEASIQDEQGKKEQHGLTRFFFFLGVSSPS